MDNDDYVYEYDDNSEVIDDTYEEIDTSQDTDDIFLIITTWLGRVGIVVAIVLVAYFIFTLKFTSLILYILGLVVAYFFGYGFMYLMEKFNH